MHEARIIITSGEPAGIGPDIIAKINPSDLKSINCERVDINEKSYNIPTQKDVILIPGGKRYEIQIIQ